MIKYLVKFSSYGNDHDGCCSGAEGEDDDKTDLGTFYKIVAEKNYKTDENGFVLDKNVFDHNNDGCVDGYGYCYGYSQENTTLFARKLPDDYVYIEKEIDSCDEQLSDLYYQDKEYYDTKDCLSKFKIDNSISKQIKSLLSIKKRVDISKYDKLLEDIENIKNTYKEIKNEITECQNRLCSLDSKKRYIYDKFIKDSEDLNENLRT
jgi:hypothetical protein